MSDYDEHAIRERRKRPNSQYEWDDDDIDTFLEEITRLEGRCEFLSRFIGVTSRRLDIRDRWVDQLKAELENETRQRDRLEAELAEAQESRYPNSTDNTMASAIEVQLRAFEMNMTQVVKRLRSGYLPGAKATEAERARIVGILREKLAHFEAKGHTGKGMLSGLRCAIKAIEGET